jgi:hypothetical protein
MRRVLITGARAPVALDLAHSFAAAGFEPHLADSLAPCTARLSAFGRGHLHRYAAPRHNVAAFSAGLARLVAALEVELVIPVCEEVFYAAAASPGCRVFAPGLPWLRRLHSKHDFIALVAACGLAAPRTHRLTSSADVAAWRADARHLVFKPEFSRFATQTLVRPAPEQLRALKPSPGTPWVVQEFVSGEELCLWSAAIAGEVVAFAAYRPRWRLGHAASYYFEPVAAPEARRFCQTIAAAGGLTGQLAFDVIRTADGGIVPLECNPRGTSGIHLFRRSPDLARALMGEGQAGPRGGPVCLGAAMALLGLPQALRAGQTRRFLQDWRRADEALPVTSERLGAVLDAARFALTGLRHGRSATAQSTADIEWDGGG